MEMYLGPALMWLRYIDDVLILWYGTIETLEIFLLELNASNRNICFTFSYDYHKRVDGGKLISKTYRKEIVANTLLEATSHHLKSLIRGSPTGKFLWMWWKCTYRTVATQLYGRFKERKHPHRTLQMTSVPKNKEN